MSAGYGRGSWYPMGSATLGLNLTVTIALCITFDFQLLKMSAGYGSGSWYLMGSATL